MCFGLGYRGVPVPLGSKALVLTSYLRILLIGLLIYALIELVAGDFVRGVIDMLFILIAALAVKKPNNIAIDYSRIMCLTIFSFVRLIMSIVLSAMFFASSTVTSEWTHWLSVVLYTAGPPLWACGVALSGSLYLELKRTLNEMVASMDGGEAGMGGGGASSGMGFGGMFGGQQQQRAPAAEPAPASSGYQAPLLRGGGASDATPAGFRAFAGQGHRIS